MDSSSDKPILIAVVGVTGAGKSTFINRVCKNESQEVGHSINSCTHETTCVPTLVDGKKVVLIDTPGFDDSHRSDVDVLTDIARVLAETNKYEILLNGIILLQPIDGNRAYGSEHQRTELFRRICGVEAYDHVVIGTTMWEKLKYRHRREARRHVQERQDSEDLWADLVEHGAEVVEHYDKEKSARDIVRKLMSKGKVVLQLQKELAENDGYLYKTTIGSRLLEDLEKRRDEAKSKLGSEEGKEARPQLRQRHSSKSRWKRMFLKPLVELDNNISVTVNAVSPETAGLTQKVQDLEQQILAVQNQKVDAEESTPDWIKALLAITSVGISIGTVVLPLVAPGACSVM